MRKVSIFGAVIGLMLTLAPDTQALGHDTRAGAVVGIVTTATGRPVPDAVVIVHGTTIAGRTITVRTQTNAEGKFGWRHFPAGRYVAGSSVDRLGAGRTQFGVRPGHLSRVHIVLQ